MLHLSYPDDTTITTLLTNMTLSYNMIPPAKMVKFFFHGILVNLSSRRRTPVISLVLILIWTPLVLLWIIIVHLLIAIWPICTKTNAYDHVVDIEYTKIPMSDYPTRFEVKDRVVDF